MAFRLAEAYVEFGQRGMSGLTGVLGGIHSRIMRLLNPINLVTGALGVMGAALTAREIARAFSQSELAGARLGALVKATGMAAGFTAGELQAMASDLQKVTMFEDDATSEASAMLLTFKSIRGDVFKGVLESAMDVASVFKTDLPSAVLQLGKAFEDPARGMGALRRTGVTFSKEEEERIKQLQEQGRLTEAQIIMLDVLKGQFGGAARAMANTTTGAFAQMRNAVGDIMEEIGRAFDEAFDFRGMAARIKDFAASFWDNYGAVIVPAIRQAADAVMTFAKTFASYLIPVVKYAWRVFSSWAAVLDNDVAAGFAKITALILGGAGTIYAIRLVIGVVKGLAVAFQVVTKAIVWFHALSGPRGWLLLATGIAAGTTAIYLLTKRYEKLNEEMERASNQKLPNTPQKEVANQVGDRFMGIIEELERSSNPAARQRETKWFKYATPEEVAGLEWEPLEQPKKAAQTFAEFLEAAQASTTDPLKERAKEIAARFVSADPKLREHMLALQPERLQYMGGQVPAQQASRDFSFTGLADLANTMQQEAGKRLQEQQLAEQKHIATVAGQIYDFLKGGRGAGQAAPLAVAVESLGR